MMTLGINAAFHDSSAAIVCNGVVLAAAEEERFTRIKHGKRPLPFTAWELPFHAIDFCLQQAGVQLAEVDHVAYSYNPRRFIGERAAGAQISLPLEPAAQPAQAGWESPWDPLFAAYMVNVPRQLASGVPHHLTMRFVGVHADGPYRFHFVDHHLAHQGSAFLAAPFAHCAVMTLDGRGEHASTTYGVYRDDRYLGLGEVGVPHSLGLLYERVTSHLGFQHSSDEYKVMALAALGQSRYRGLLSEHVRIGAQGQFQVLPLDLEALVGPARVRGALLQERHLDLAASLQAVLEDTVLSLAAWLRQASGEPYLALAGGVALNCVLNARLRDASIFEQIWVQPACGDAGTAMGAALWIDARLRSGALSHQPPALLRPKPLRDGGGAALPLELGPRCWRMEHAYLGPMYDDEQIEAYLHWAGLRHRRVDDPALAAADLLAEGCIIGWFQGRMEFGPRALGARSILASPTQAAMQARINELKDREDFRPVAPAVPEEHLADWFAPAQANGGSAPFMVFVYQVLARQAARIPAVCHVDGTARVQTVSRASNPVFHRLLSAFGQRTGVPVLINTSFNVRGEPIVCTPKDAVQAFYSSPIDALVIGSYVLEKQP